MKIYLTGGWGYGNIGDEAILMSMMRSLDKTLDQPEIVLTSFAPNETMFHHGLASLPSLHRLLYLRLPHRLRTRLPFQVSLAVALLMSPLFILTLALLYLWGVGYKLTKRHFLPYRVLRQHILEMESSDLVIMGGGGYFNDLWWTALPARLAEIWVPSILGKKVMIYGQTVGPFNSKFSRRFFGQFLRMVDTVCYRDAQSEQTLNSYNYAHDSALLTADEAILLAPEQEFDRTPILRKYGFDPRNLTVGLMFQNFRAYSSPNGDEPFEEIRSKEQYLQEVEKIILGISAEEPVNLLFLPSTSWDAPLCALLRSRVAANIRTGSFIAMSEESRVSEYVSLCQSVDVMLSTNMHPIILAATNGIPSLAISYWYKIDDFMESVGQQSNIWRIDRFTSEGVISRFEEVMRNRDHVSSDICAHLEKVRLRARLNAASAKLLVKDCEPTSDDAT